MKIEILHTRDPDSSCDIEVYIDGEQVNPVDIIEHSVDPGAGHVRIEWDEETEEIRDDTDLSPAFRAAVVERREAYADNEYITGTLADDEED